MDLKEHYTQLYKDSIYEISLGHYQIDAMIHSDSDKRFGLSLIIRPSIAVKNNIQKFIGELKKGEPHQYYYPNSDIHITLLSIISCHEGFHINLIELPKYIALIQKVLVDQQPIKIRFKGVTASTSCIMIQGFMDDNSVNLIRNKLRKAFKKEDIFHSIDTRYALHTAHATVFRFSKKLQQKSTFLATVEKYRDYDFGSFEVHNMELVSNDWYQRAAFVKTLHQFKMKK